MLKYIINILQWKRRGKRKKFIYMFIDINTCKRIKMTKISSYSCTLTSQNSLFHGCQAFSW